MEDRCTCGAKLAEDSRFCHRCGRPLREEPPEVDDDEAIEELVEEKTVIEPDAPIPMVTLQPLQEISFRNSQAVRVGIIVALLIQFGLMVSVPLGMSMLAPVIHLAGGVYAVFLYRRRAGSGLTIVNGARMGWITGVFAFVLITIFFTLSMALIAGSDQFLDAYKESARSMGLTGENSDKLGEYLRNPLFLLGALGFQFLMLTLLCSLGGALGAKLSHREN